VLDVETVLDHDDDGVVRCYGGRDEGWKGGRDVGVVFGDGEDVVELWEAFFHYVWYGVEYW